ncbi:MAG: response regulator [Parasporobacterium sp.]|nr:response regulator [Parasporobacterium sp.]
MERRIVIISHGAAFMVGAIEKNLKEAKFEVATCDANVKDLSACIEHDDILLIYLGDYVEDVKETWVYLKDTCIEKDMRLNVIGNDKEMDIFKQTITESLIDNYFERPLDIKSLVAVMEDIFTASSINSRKKNILIVDDDPTFLKTVKDWLSGDYRVNIVSSGMQAITYIAKHTPDLILLDYEMPVTTGPQVLEMIRSESATGTIPVMFLTGKDDRQSVEKVLKLKPQGYILKSVGKEKLKNQIRDFFEGLKSKSY